MGLEQFLMYLVTKTGVAVAVNVVLMVVTSYALEFWPKWDEISPARKRLLFMGPVSFVIPCAATALGILLYGWPNVIDPTWWNALVAGGLAAGAGTAMHTFKLRGK